MLQAPRGTKDIFGDEVLLWQRIEQIMRSICEDYGISELRSPIFEHTELYVKGTGDTTDIVQKEMYTFEDKGNRSITLRPEGTPGAIRAYLEHGMSSNPQPVKLYYISPNFRYEKPQAGRMRQFHQFGIEYLGSYSPSADAEVISVAFELLRRLDVKGLTLSLNSLGGPSCRAKYNAVLKEYLSANKDGLCDQCKERLETNPLRILDCKEESCKQIVAGAPSTLDSLGSECSEHFETLQNLLTVMEIPFVVDSKIVRGLDYYTRTVFEFVSDELGAQSTLCGGGRYDNLVESFGGQKTGAVGFGMGIERLTMILAKQQDKAETKIYNGAYIGGIGKNGSELAQKIALKLRMSGIYTESDIMERSVKAQLKFADKKNLKYTVIIGDTELETKILSVKNMETGESIEISIEEVTNYILDNN